MGMTRRKTCTAAALALLGARSGSAFAQAPGAWRPTGDIELVVGAAAGGAVDQIARTLQGLMRNAPGLGGLNITVLNKPGAGQTAAMTYMAQHRRSPNQLVLMSPSVVNSSLTMGLGRPHHDVTPIMKLFDGDLLYSAGAHTGMRTLEDLVERLRRDVRSVSFAFSTSPGNTSHISIAQLATLVGGKARDLRVVVNPSGSATVAQVAGGHVDVGITSTFTMQPMVGAGRATFLAVAGPSRLSALPDVPTFRERGYEVIATSWYAVCAAKDITSAQAAFWEGVFADIMAGEEAKEVAKRLSWNIEVVGAAALPAFFDKEYDSQRQALIELGLLRQ